jgi:hypothetical protein
MKQKIMIYLGTKRIHGWGAGVELGWYRENFETPLHLFRAATVGDPQTHCSSLWAGPGFAGLFIGSY